VKKILKYALKLYRKIDVAPLDSSHLSFKVAIFLVWGVNILFFVTKDIVANEILADPACKHKTSILIIKTSPLSLSYDIEFEFYLPMNFGIISSYTFELTICEPQRLDRERSPPLSQYTAL
jgi:hypothetical protein